MPDIYLIPGTFLIPVTNILEFHSALGIRVRVRVRVRVTNMLEFQSGLGILPSRCV